MVFNYTRTSSSSLYWGFKKMFIMILSDLQNAVICKKNAKNFVEVHMSAKLKKTQFLLHL